MEITKQLRTLIEPVINRMGYGIVHLHHFIRINQNVLEVKVYCLDYNPLSIKDCVAISKIVNPILDSYDILKQQYAFEVVSLGAKKILKNKLDFLDARNEKKVTILSKDQIVYSGALLSVEETNCILSAKSDIMFYYKDIQLAYTEY